MQEEKRNRIIAAVTVNVILLIVILVAVCIYQLVVMTSLGKLKQDLNDRLEYIQTETDNAEKTLEYYKSQEGLLDKAFEYGFVFGK